MNAVPTSPKAIVITIVVTVAIVLIYQHGIRRAFPSLPSLAG